MKVYLLLKELTNNKKGNRKDDELMSKNKENEITKEMLDEMINTVENKLMRLIQIIEVLYEEEKVMTDG